MNDVLDLSRPHQDLDKGSDPEIFGADFIEQDGIVFGWSDSNVQYERAWWLDEGVRQSPLVSNIHKDRPLPGRTHAEVIAAISPISEQNP